MIIHKEGLNIIKNYITEYKNSNNIKREKLLKKLIDKNVLIKTEDGTYTFLSEDPNECMHSKIGAMTESIEKFVKPSNLANIKNPKILDLCSGMGYNTVAALHYNQEAIIDMVEYCEEILFLSLFLDIPLPEHNIVKKVIENYFKGEDNNTKNIKLYVGDARNIVKKLKDNYYDIIFHDAFSPQRDCVLYTVDFLKILYDKLKDGGLLISYSSSIPFRSGLVECGYIISEYPSVGRKRGITIGYKNLSGINRELEDKIDGNKINNKIKRISPIDERLIALSTVGVPYRDKYLNLDHDTVVKNREIEREEFKRKLIKLGRYYSTKRIKLGNIPEKYLKIQESNSNSTEIINNLKKLLLD